MILPRFYYSSADNLKEIPCSDRRNSLRIVSEILTSFFIQGCVFYEVKKKRLLYSNFLKVCLHPFREELDKDWHRKHDR